MGHLLEKIWGMYISHPVPYLVFGILVVSNMFFIFHGMSFGLLCPQNPRLYSNHFVVITILIFEQRSVSAGELCTLLASPGLVFGIICFKDCTSWLRQEPKKEKKKKEKSKPEPESKKNEPLPEHRVHAALPTHTLSYNCSRNRPGGLSAQLSAAQRASLVVGCFAVNLFLFKPTFTVHLVKDNWR